MSVGTKLLIGGVALAGAIGFVAYLGASSSWQYYLTVDECLAGSTKFSGSRIRVSGRVSQGSLRIEQDRTSAAFLLAGTEGTLSTTCPGPLPDNLAEDMDVVVEGVLKPGNQLCGEKVLTRCASKYESD